MKRKKASGVSGILSVLLCLTLLVGMFAGCSSNTSSAPNAAPERNAAAQDSVKNPGIAQGDKAAPGTAAGEAAPADGSTETPTKAAAAALATQKIIERLSYQIETLKFDDSVRKIQSMCTELGGYVQDSNVTGDGIQNKGGLRQASYTLRIPQEKVSQLKSRAGEIGSILNSSSSSENVSEKYYDTEARLKSLRTQQDRLLALMQKSGSLTDVIALEKALADVNYQIEQLTGTLREYDSLINFSTVSIQLNEVIEPTETEKTPVTLGEKIARQFQNSMRGLGNFGEALLIFFLGGAPIILLLLLIAVVLYWALLGRKKHAGKKKASQAVPGPEKSIEPDDGHSDK